jgi:hypothetical protein
VMLTTLWLDLKSLTKMKKLFFKFTQTVLKQDGVTITMKEVY